MEATESQRKTCEKGDEIEREALHLMGLGLDVMPLEPRSKVSFAANWPAAAPHSAETFRAARKPGGNIGLRTGRPAPGGFLHVLDFDVDAPSDEALTALHELLPPNALRCGPVAVSGNASGQRRHYYFCCEAPLRKAVRYVEGGKLELLGRGQQAVLPPSVHPVSGLPYRWLQAPEADDLGIGAPIAPVLPLDRALAWGAEVWAETVPVEHVEAFEPAPDQLERAAERLAAWAAELAETAEGGRDDKANAAVFWAAGAARLGFLTKAEAEAALIPAALACGLKQSEISKKFRDRAAWGKGWKRPLTDFSPARDWDAMFGELEDLEPTAVEPEACDWHVAAFDEACDPDLSHDQLALDLGRAGWNRDARYCAPVGGWLLWRGQHWEAESGMRPMAVVRNFVRAKARELVGWADRKGKTMSTEDAAKLRGWAKAQAHALRQDHTIAAVERLARSNVKALATPEQWDTHDMLLGTPGGTVDLKTGELREARREDYITTTTAIAPGPVGVQPEAWLRFLGEVFPGEPEMIGFMQRLAGYALTGSTREHRLFLFHGSGRNGKGTLLGTLQAIMGDYAKGIPTAILIESRSPQHKAPLARLRGARMVRGAELPVGQVWDEGLIKMLTGGDPIPVNHMRGETFDLVPKFTLIVDANTRPRIRTTDVAMRSRMTLIPFRVSFTGREDRTLPERLKAEAPGILRWAIDGAVAWQREGLRIPASVEKASREYLDSEDSLAHFLEDETQPAPGNRVAANVLYARYRAWAIGQGIASATQRAFGGMLTERGVERFNSNGARGFIGLRLRGSLAEGGPDEF